MRDIAISSFLVAAVAIGAVDAPVDDEAQTPSDRTVTILPLLNDPSGSTITAVGTPTAGGTVTISGDSLLYTPPATSPEFTGADTFTYDTPGGTATVTVAVVGAVASSGALALDDAYLIANGTGQVVLEVLDNDFAAVSDPNGLSLLSVSQPVTIVDPNDIFPAAGTTRIVGNNVLYIPQPGVNDVLVRFFYQTTQGGFAQVDIQIGDPFQNTVTPRTVVIVNSEPVAVEVTITNDNVFIDCNNPNATTATGNVSVQQRVGMEPFSELEVCIDAERNVTFEATTQSGNSTNPRTLATCNSDESTDTLYLLYSETGGDPMGGPPLAGQLSCSSNDPRPGLMMP